MQERLLPDMSRDNNGVYLRNFRLNGNTAEILILWQWEANLHSLYTSHRLTRIINLTARRN
jgi:hypothetical protein